MMIRNSFFWLALSAAFPCTKQRATSTAFSVAVPPSKGLRPSPKSDNMNRNAPGDVEVSFSHVHLYVDTVEELSVYKELENQLNEFARHGKVLHDREDVDSCRELFQSISNNENPAGDFEPQNRDIVKQLIAGLGFRVTGARMPTSAGFANARSVLVTSRDPAGVQFIVTARTEGKDTHDEYSHFDASNLDRFFDCHHNRQGMAVLGFQTSCVDALYQRYLDKHANLILDKSDYEEAKVLEVFAYYNGDSSDSGVDMGTVLRYVEPKLALDEASCILPGFTFVDATFDESCRAAYCDHWVSNVVSRTSFISTLEDTLGFTPKVDFNAGVVAAGEAQIESTVAGNNIVTSDLNISSVLSDQRQVYLPINNALSEVGHVHGFLKEIGQGVQHVASRVDNLVEFVQRGNDYRKITNEGFTFLNIPRSYYGVLTLNDFTKGAGDDKLALSKALAEAIMEACHESNICSQDSSVSLDLTRGNIEARLDSSIPSEHREEYAACKSRIIDRVLQSRYTNLYNLLGDQLTEEGYLGVVRNQILVDVQGEDLLFQIFTSNILQRKAGEEAPFFEFIQRVCSVCKDENGCPLPAKPGCGGFGIRNFLTLFLSIEVSKAMAEASKAKSDGDSTRLDYASSMVSCFTDQLNESNPILTEISNAMTLEGQWRDKLQSAQDRDEISHCQHQMEAASLSKNKGNAKLMECSMKYKNLMKSIREQHA